MSAGGFNGGALTAPPSSTGGALPQQGSLDWFKLAGSSVSFTIDVLARMSAAGVEAFTVCAATTTLSRLRLGRIGESRVQEAVLRLKAFSSVNNALWFGFGVKHLIKKLAESYEGLCCIAVCASLSEFYSTPDASRILREIFVQYNAPSSLTPALRQWTNLVEACEGALSSTTFPVLVHEITRLYLPDGNTGLRHRADPAAIAKALNGLFQVSNGSLESVQFLGGADCGWIAAFAHWLLDLSVEIRDISGETLYRPAAVNSSALRDAQVLVIFGGSTTNDLQLVSKAFVVPGGQSLVRKQEFMQGDVLSYGRVQWDSLLQDVFGKPFKMMLHADLATLCGSALGCAARIFTGFVTSEEETDRASWSSYRKTWTYVNSGSHGQGFCNTVRQWLPELAQSQMLMDSMEHNLSIICSEAVNEYKRTIHGIAAACCCNGCALSSQPGLTPSHQQHRPFCQVILVEVISDIVQIVSALDMKTKILPTRCGLEGLYWNRVYKKRKEEGFDYLLNGLLSVKDRKPLMAAQELFTGRQISASYKHMGQSALASNGLCFYLDTLVSVSANTEQCNLVHVVPGRVEWNGSLFEDVIELPHVENQLLRPHYEASPGQVETLTSWSSVKDSVSLDLTCDLVLQESIVRYHEKSIMASYRMTTSNGQFMVSPFTVAVKLCKALRGPNCRGLQCAGVEPFKACLVQGEGLMYGHHEHPPELPILRVLRKSVPAQWIAVLHSDYWTGSVHHDNICILQTTQCFHCLCRQASRVRGKDKAVLVLTASQEEDL